jgi:large subunit ribosomal protein L30
MSQIKITQEKSKIRCLKKHKRTLVALGLRRIRHTVVHEDTPQIRGMVDQVRYLVRVEAADGAKASSAGATKTAKPRAKAPAKPRAKAAAGRTS